MSAPFSTLLLDTVTWDLCADASNNIARADPPYGIAQDVASAIKTFFAEVWYDDTLGVRWLTQILGQSPPVSLFQEYMVNAALTVPGVVKAKCVISSYTNRNVTGQVRFVDVNNNPYVVNY